tara:strand:+ start:263 stop:388 length:126 start_codon:yes stop_codon:yes gene_type:complete
MGSTVAEKYNLGNPDVSWVNANKNTNANDNDFAFEDYALAA